MPRASRTRLGFVRAADGAGYQPAVQFSSGRVVTDDDGLLSVGLDRRLHEVGPGEIEIECGVLDRREDESGVSGTGVVADFAEFPSGRVVMEWRNDENPDLSFDDTGLDVRPSMEAAVGIHGHSGRSQFVFDSGEVAGEATA